MKTLSFFAGVGLMFSIAPIAVAQMYYRADLGYAESRSAGYRDKDQNPATSSICPNFACTPPSKFDHLGSSGVVSGGLGFRHSQNLRWDATVEYRPGYRLDNVDGAGTRHSAKIRSYGLMLNGYYDIPMGSNLVPFLTAGIGLSRNEIKTVTANNWAAPGITLSWNGGKKDSIAWAVGGGVAYRVSERLTVDLTYKYINLGKLDIPSGGISGGVIPGATHTGYTGDLKGHQIQLGLRF